MSYLNSSCGAEDVHIPVRIIAAPAAGTFTPAPQAVGEAGGAIDVGQVVGVIELLKARVEVVSPHAGQLAGLLALPGERVRQGQPVVWLHVG